MVVLLGAGKPAISPLSVKPLVSSEPTHFEYELQERTEESSARSNKMQFVRMRGAGTPPPRSMPPPRPPDPFEETDVWSRSLRKKTAEFLADMEAFRAEMRNEFRQLRVISNTNLHLLDCFSPTMHEPQTQSSLVTTPPIQPPSALVTLPLTHSPTSQSLLTAAQPIHEQRSPIVHSHLWKARCKQVSLNSTAPTGGVKKPHKFKDGIIMSLRTSKYLKHSKLLMLKVSLVTEMAEEFKADKRSQKSVVPPMSKEVVSVWTNHTPASIGFVSDSQTRVLNVNFGSDNCDVVDYVLVANEVGENLKKVKGESPDDMVMVGSGDANECCQLDGVDVRQDIQGPNSCEQGREPDALHLFEKMPRSDNLCNTGAITSTRHKEVITDEEWGGRELLNSPTWASLLKAATCGVSTDVWREFLWGGIAGAFGEGMMHLIDTVKTRIQSQAIFSASQHQKSILQMVRTVWAVDGLKGFYRGIAPGVTGSLATGATYFGVIESTKKWIEDSHPNLGGHWAHFIAGAVGDTLGSFVYVPCEVMKQHMQVQGTKASWSSMKPGIQMYDYYTGMFQAGCLIWKEQGPKGLYAGFGSTLARDVPGRLLHINGSFEGLILGGLAGGMSSFLSTLFLAIGGASTDGNTLTLPELPTLLYTSAIVDFGVSICRDKSKSLIVGPNCNLNIAWGICFMVIVSNALSATLEHYMEDSKKISHFALLLCFSGFDKKVRDKGSGYPLLTNELGISSNAMRRAATATVSLCNRNYASLLEFFMDGPFVMVNEFEGNIKLLLVCMSNWISAIGNSETLAVETIASDSVFESCLIYSAQEAKVRGGLNNFLGMIPGGTSVLLITKDVYSDVGMKLVALKHVQSGLRTAVCIMMDKSTDVVGAAAQFHYVYIIPFLSCCYGNVISSSWRYRELNNTVAGWLLLNLSMLLQWFLQIETLNETTSAAFLCILDVNWKKDQGYHVNLEGEFLVATLLLDQMERKMNLLVVHALPLGKDGSGCVRNGELGLSCRSLSLYDDQFQAFVSSSLDKCKGLGWSITSLQKVTMLWTMILKAIGQPQFSSGDDGVAPGYGSKDDYKFHGADQRAVLGEKVGMINSEDKLATKFLSELQSSVTETLICWYEYFQSIIFHGIAYAALLNFSSITSDSSSKQLNHYLKTHREWVGLMVWKGCHVYHIDLSITAFKTCLFLAFTTWHGPVVVVFAMSLIIEVEEKLQCAALIQNVKLEDKFLLKGGEM